MLQQLWSCFWKSLYDQIHQTPRYLIKFTENSTKNELNCSNTIPSYDLTSWYKQDKDGTITLLGYMNLKYLTIEDAFKDKININGDGSSKTSLSISNLTVEDSGVYYCAPSMHSGITSLVSYQKLTSFKLVLEEQLRK
uniref:Ig-like domain-containing protein n=1 Tax=Periophthalmus magnuspinnatus TaxID=409849 RepID=A0A3B3ZBT6_9GOBI